MQLIVQEPYPEDHQDPRNKAYGDRAGRIKDIAASGTTIVLVEQDTHRAIKTAQLVHVMLKGNVVLSGSPKELSEEDIKKAYFGI